MAKISTNKENEPATENGKKKREEKPATKVVVRRLPPTMTEEQFKMQVSPLPDNDYFYYVPADKSLTPNAFCRAYINFVNQSDLFIFTQKFDGYVFVDSKGGEFPAVVEFAPFQRIPKNRPHRRKDPKTATIESDPLFILFKEHLEAQSQENKAANNASKQHFFESSLIPEKKEANNTPLIDFIKNKRAERQRIRDEKREEKRKKDLERRKAKEEQRRTKKEDETSVVKPLSPHPTHSNSKDSVRKPSANKDNFDKRNKEIEANQIVVNNHQDKNCTMANIEKNEQNIPKKFQDLVTLFNQSLFQKDNSETNPKNKTASKNCIDHKDIESQIMQNADSAYNRVTSEEQSANTIQKKWQQHKIPLLSDCNELNYTNPRLQIMPFVETRPRVFVQRPIASCQQSVHNIIMNPIENSTHDADKDNNVEDIAKVPGEVFRKNLQKVVADVLGHSKVKSPRENISKPKTFVQRACAGSGELCSRPGFNSPNFYLPPRAFGCGQTTSVSKSAKTDSKHSIKTYNAETYKPLNVFAGKNYFPLVPRKNLPPFSNKNIFSSKSDGDIDKHENGIKVGGSEESLKKQTWGLDVTRRRPHVTPKKSIILEKYNKVSL